MRASHGFRVIAGGGDRRLIQKVCQVRAGKARRSPSHPTKVELRVELHPARVYFQDRLPATNVRQVNGNLSIETAGSRERTIQHIGPVRRSDHHDARTLIKAIHFNQQLIERLILVSGC